jgi:hypothetical protein
MEEEQKPKKYYKVEAGDTVTVHRREAGGYVYYSLCFKKKNQNGEDTYIYKKIRFKGGADIPDKTKIRIYDFFEDGYKPENSYDTIWSLVITDYEIVNDAIKEYQEKKNEVEENNIEISDEMLPF